MVTLVESFIALIVLCITFLTYHMASIRHYAWTGGRDSMYYHDDLKKLLGAAGEVKDAPPVVTIGDIRQRLKYRKKDIWWKPVKHIGQRKLFLNELQFLTGVMGEFGGRPIVVYAGSSPSNHIYLLASLFPTVRFLLVDPNETNIYVKWDPKRVSHYDFDTGDICYLRVSKDNRYEVNKTKMITTADGARVSRADVVGRTFDGDVRKWLTGDSEYRIFIYEDLFTSDIARQLDGLGVYFWSDIRTNDVEDEFPLDIDVLWNLAQQYIWFKQMNPAKYMFKFKCPYMIQGPEEVAMGAEVEFRRGDFAQAKAMGVDFVGDYARGKFRYLRGEVLVQPWAGNTSSESRLVGAADEIIEYDYNDYDAAFFYYNSVERGLIHHANPYADKRIGFDHCGDCALEARIWADYASATDGEFPAALCRQLTVITNRNLLDLTDAHHKGSGHGSLFAPFTMGWYKDLAKNNARWFYEEFLG